MLRFLPLSDSRISNKVNADLYVVVYSPTSQAPIPPTHLPPPPPSQAHYAIPATVQFGHLPVSASWALGLEACTRAITCNAVFWERVRIAGPLAGVYWFLWRPLCSFPKGLYPSTSHQQCTRNSLPTLPFSILLVGVFVLVIMLDTEGYCQSFREKAPSIWKD